MYIIAWGFLFLLIATAIIKTYRKGYKDGQIDAQKGQIEYKLPDKTKQS